ncbi:hypothetical protein LINGRAHAP2_LOCUS38163 [Linum grandiflorum]
MRYSTPGMNRKRNLYWFYLLFFMKRMHFFIEGSQKNGRGSQSIRIDPKSDSNPI